MTRPASRRRCAKLSAKSEPSAPIIFRSIPAVTKPLMKAMKNQTSNGLRSREKEMRPRCHQKITSSAAGSVAVTVLLITPSTKKIVASA